MYDSIQTKTVGELKWLSWAEFWFNPNFNSSTRLTRFEALHGRDPPVLLNGTTIPSAAEEVSNEHDCVLDELCANLLHPQTKMKVQIEKHSWEMSFEERELVFLKLHPKRHDDKLSPCSYGPYQVLQRIGSVAYKLDLPGGKSPAAYSLHRSIL